MKNIIFVVEKTKTGFSSYAENFEKFPVGTTAETMSELKLNIVDAMNTYNDSKELAEISIDDITIKLNLSQFFEYYNEINAKALSKRIHMNETLLSQYVNGIKEPSEKQVQKILTGIKQLGQELSELELA